MERFEDPWVNAMNFSRLAGALHRTKERESAEEDDKFFKEKGIEAICLIKDYIHSLFNEDYCFFEGHEIGYAFHKLMEKRGIELTTYETILNSYQESLRKSINGTVDKNTAETLNFFDDFSSYFARQLPSRNLNLACA